MRNIILIGLPGSGKTSAGRRVARHFSLPFVDSDEELESGLGMRIKEYFAAHGEDAFRDEEARVLKELLQQPRPFVLSTGGGAVLRPENRQLLRSGGIVFYLHASPEAIYRRLKHDTQRPLLQVADPLAQIRSLFEKREPLYRETAHHLVPCGRGSVASTVHKIIHKIQTQTEE
ncbi:MAG: shikimate kinase [Brachymonas sp.]|nr:shikimate kinase [Brachymonas sp.]